MKKIIFILLASIATVSFSQVSPLELKGTKKFEAFSLEPAIKKYEEVGVGNLTTEGLRNLSDAYRYLHKSEKAEVSYSELVKRSDNKAEDLYMYAEVLLMNKKKTEWEKWMSNFHSRLESDGRGKEFEASRGSFAKLSEDRGQFKNIKNLESNTDKEDFGTAYHGDKVVFSSSRKTTNPIKRVWNWTEFPFLNLFEADQTSTNELEGVKKLSRKVNKKYHEGPASYSKDGKLMVFTRNNYDEKSEDKRIKLKMFYRELDDQGDWGDIEGFDFNYKEYSVGHPAVSPDGKTIYFASDMPGGLGKTDLYKTTRNGSGVWSTPVNLGSTINTEGKEMFPFYHKDGMLFFASDGKVGLGGLDIFVSQDNEGEFSAAQNLGSPVNDSKDDFALLLNEDQTKGYFSSNRPGGKGSDDIYSFKLAKPFTSCKTIKGLAKDESGNILPGTEVALTDGNGTLIEKVIVGDDGGYSFCLDPGNYKLEGTQPKYTGGNNSVNLTDNSPSVSSADVVLNKQADFSFCGIVSDSKTKKPLSGVTINLIHKLTGAKEVIVTDAKGDFCRELDNKLNDYISYDLELSKPGYFSKTVTYSQKLTRQGRYDIAADLISLDKEVSDLANMIEINPINFDLNKSFIRPDAKIELDKIVAVMNKYPGMVIELGAHTDCRASRSYNRALSNRRAVSSAKYIKSRISNPERIYGKGYGESKLLNGCACEGKVKAKCSEAEHERNRRTEFKVIKTGNDKVKVKNNSTDSF